MKRLCLGLLVSAIVFCAAPSQAQDDIDFAQAILTPSTVASWPIATRISQVQVTPRGLHIEFDQRDRWPNVVPPGWDGPIEFTVWLGAKLDDGWHLAASLNVWNGDGDGGSRGYYGGPVSEPSQYPTNLYYLDAALHGHTPQVGEPLALFVTAGAQRGVNAFAIAARSDVVTFLMPGENGATFNYGSTDAPPPVVTPEPQAPSPQPPAVDLSAVLSRLDAIDAKLDALKAQNDANTEKVQQQIDQVVKDMEKTAKSLAPFLGLFGGKK